MANEAQNHKEKSSVKSQIFLLSQDIANQPCQCVVAFKHNSVKLAIWTSQKCITSSVDKHTVLCFLL